MNSKLFWSFVAVEVVVAGVVGWKIANATRHPWAVQPQRPRPPGRRRNPSMLARGARQREGNPVSHANAVRGSFTTRRSS